MSVVNQPLDIPPHLQNTYAAAATVLTVPRRNGHRRTLLDYFVKDGASGFTDITVGNVTLMRIYDNLNQATLITDQSVKFKNHGFFWWLAEMIKDFPEFTVAEDEDLGFVRDSAADMLTARWADDQGGDVKNHQLPGGSQGKKFPFILNLNNAAAISASGTTALDNQDMPTGLTMFTDGSRMSANNKFTLYGLAGDFPVATNSHADRIHIFDEFTELFTSEGHQGLLVDPNIVNELAFDFDVAGYFWLDEPYVFMPNRTISVKLDATYDGAHPLLINSQKLFMIGIREYV
jgi:hypothetical protein